MNNDDGWGMFDQMLVLVLQSGFFAQRTRFLSFCRTNSYWPFPFSWQVSDDQMGSLLASQSTKFPSFCMVILLGATPLSFVPVDQTASSPLYSTKFPSFCNLAVYPFPEDKQSPSFSDSPGQRVLPKLPVMLRQASWRIVRLLEVWRANRRTAKTINFIECLYYTNRQNYCRQIIEVMSEF